MPPRRISVLAAALAALVLTVVGCTNAPPAETPAEVSDAEEAWPRTVEIPAGESTPASSITLESEPQRIAALDYESAEVIAELGFADRVVLVPEAVLNPHLGAHTEELSDVEATFPVAMEVDAETVIALAPDLVVMSPRHGNEAPIAVVLQQADVPVLQLPDAWNNSASLLVNIELIGQAIGGEEAATGLASDIAAGLAAESAPQELSDDAPRVLVLTNQAGRPFVTAGDAYPIELLGLAGAQSIAVELGIHRTGPIAAEQIVQADPDGIVLIDMNGSGDRMYEELLANPAVAATSAVAGDRILRIEGGQVQALGLAATIDGLAQLTAWVDTL